MRVDGRQCLHIVRATLDGRLEEGHPATKVASLAQAFTFERQLQTGDRWIHGDIDRKRSVTMRELCGKQNAKALPRVIIE